MGQKVHPHGLRVGVIKDWDARWYAPKKEFANTLVEDVNLRKALKEKLFAAGISKIEIERAVNRVKVNIFTAKPGIVIGKGGAGVNTLKDFVQKFTNKAAMINIVEIKQPDTDAQLVAENIAAQLERRISFRRAMKQTMSRSLKAGAKGIKVMVAGRLNGAEIARTEWYREGNIPLQTLRADVEYGFAEAKTTYGRIGVKVWIYKGEILPQARRLKEGAEQHADA
jgi:small subunit ribosomal protein S3